MSKQITKKALQAKLFDISQAEEIEDDSLLKGLAQSLANTTGKTIAIEPAGIRATPHPTGGDMEQKTELKYCSYCRKQTPHKVIDSKTDGKGTGRNLQCIKCGSARLGEIQGFDAALM